MLESATVCPACGAARYDSPPTGSFEKQGNPSTADQPAAAPPPRSTDLNPKEAATSQPKWQCPKCDSENVQKLSVIFSEGTTSTRQGMMGLGIGGSGAIGGAVGGGTSSTTLAKSVAPPTAPKEPSAVLNTMGVAGCATLLVFLLLGFLFLLAMGDDQLSRADKVVGATLCALILLLVRWRFSSAARSLKQKQEAEYQVELAAYNEALAIYNEAMAQWQRSYFCHRCGNIFELQSS